MTDSRTLKVRILLSTDVTVRGGVDGYVLDLIDALRRSGHEPALALEEKTTSALRNAAVDVMGVPPRLVPLYHRLHDPASMRTAAVALIEDVKPHGVHAVCGSPFSCLALREVAVERGLRLIISEQQIKDDLALTVEHATRIASNYRSARHVVFVSEGNRSTMARLVGMGGTRSTVIVSGIHVALVQMRASAVIRRARSHGLRVMTAARFSSEKALDVLLQAVAVLPGSVVDHVDLYGEGPEWHALDGLIRRLGLTNRATLHSWRADIPEQLKQHDLFVLPSIAEGMPYALLEAMAVGVPIIASDVSGNMEALDGGAAGVIVPRGDVGALASAMALHSRNPHQAVALSQAARVRVRSHYDVSHQMRRTVGLWESERNRSEISDRRTEE